MLFQFSRRARKNYRSVILTSAPGKIIEKIILGVIKKHLKDSMVIGYIQQGFMRGQSCFTNLIFFCDKLAHLGNQGKSADIIFLDFSEAFLYCLSSILLTKYSAHS